MTESRPLPGLYIDISNAASCTGFIRQWNVCHYNPRFFSRADNTQIQLQVWRFDQARRNGILVDSNVATVIIPQQPPDFQCVDIEISQDQFINVTAGDFLGVELSRDVLPVVSNYRQPGPSPTLIFTPNRVFSITMVTRNTSGVVDLTTNAIHVTAEGIIASYVSLDVGI